MEIIAEIGQNFNGDLKLAENLIRLAAESGANVVKFQLYDAESLFPKKNNPWFEYNCKTELSKNDTKLISKICCDYGIEFMATPFDIERVYWLEELGVKRYKIASRSINDTDLINTVIRTGKPIIASLGMCDEPYFPKINADDVSYLYCISKYPTQLTDINLRSLNLYL